MNISPINNTKFYYREKPHFTSHPDKKPINKPTEKATDKNLVDLKTLLGSLSLCTLLLLGGCSDKNTSGTDNIPNTSTDNSSTSEACIQDYNYVESYMNSAKSIKERLYLTHVENNIKRNADVKLIRGADEENHIVSIKVKADNAHWASDFFGRLFLDYDTLVEAGIIDAEPIDSKIYDELTDLGLLVKHNYKNVKLKPSYNIPKSVFDEAIRIYPKELEGEEYDYMEEYAKTKECFDYKPKSRRIKNIADVRLIKNPDDGEDIVRISFLQEGGIAWGEYLCTQLCLDYDTLVEAGIIDAEPTSKLYNKLAEMGLLTEDNWDNTFFKGPSEFNIPKSILEEAVRKAND